jgi:hypothetical protein
LDALEEKYGTTVDTTVISKVSLALFDIEASTDGTLTQQTQDYLVYRQTPFRDSDE